MPEIDQSLDKIDLLTSVLAEQAANAGTPTFRPAEQYLDTFPDLANCETSAVDVIYHEYLLLGKSGNPPPNPQNFLDRFPEHADALRAQFQIAAGFATASLDLSALGHAPTETINLSLPSRYQCGAMIGEGGFAWVYKATDVQLKRQVAIKVSKSPCDLESRLYRRFAREAEAAASLSHPGIVPVYEFGILDSRPFIVQQLALGGTLEDLLSEEPIAPTQAAKWVAEVCEAMDYAHQCNVVHRDIKPSNILIGEAGRLRITDFGLAAFTEDERTLTHTGEMVGTPAYMSPEQITGANESTVQSDVYSIGVLLYQLIVGRLPFRGNMASTLRQIADTDPVPPRQLVPNVPHDLSTICLKAMQKSPIARYQSTRQLAEDLYRFLDREPILARPASRYEKLARKMRRHPVASGLGALVLFAICFILGGSVQYYNLLKQRNVAEQAQQRASQLAAAKAADAGYLSMQRGRTQLATTHFKEAIELGYSKPHQLHLRLAECELIHGRPTEAIAFVDMIPAGQLADDVLLLRARIALLGSPGDRSAVHLLSEIQQDNLAAADVDYLHGLEATNSRRALGHFKSALEKDTYHHGARRMASIVALSLADFEYVSDLAASSRQLYPDDVEFALIECLCQAASRQLNEGLTLLNSTNLEQGERADWHRLLNYVHTVCCELNTGGDRIFTSRTPDSGLKYDDFVDLLLEFDREFSPVIRLRRWYLPPAIASRLGTFLAAASTDSRSASTEVLAAEVAIAEAHPEATLLTSIARRIIESGVGDLETVLRVQKYYETASSCQGFLQDTASHARLGVFTAAIHLAVIHGYKQQENATKALETLKKIDPKDVHAVENLRVMTIYPIQQGKFELGARFVDRWLEMANHKNDTTAARDALWHKALVLEFREDWYHLLQTCSGILEIPAEDTAKEPVRQLRKRAEYELKMALSSE